MATIVDRALQWYARFESTLTWSIAAVLYTAAMLVMLVEAVSRFLFNVSFFWAEELTRFLVVWAFFMTIGLAGRQGWHIRMHLLVDSLPPSLRRAAEAVACTAGVLYCSILLYASYTQIARYHTMGMVSESSLALPMWVVFLALPIGGLMFLAYYLEGVIRAARGLRAIVDRD